MPHPGADPVRRLLDQKAASQPEQSHHDRHPLEALDVGGGEGGGAPGHRQSADEIEESEREGEQEAGSDLYEELVP
jgi:hypothetical protein